MKNLFYLTILAAVLTSCGPIRHAIHVEMRHPSKSGIDLAAGIGLICVFCGAVNCPIASMVLGMEQDIARSVNLLFFLP